MRLVHADFHTHTTFSDSSRSPKELIEAMIGAGIEYGAITDHDTMGVFEEEVLETVAEELKLSFTTQDRRIFTIGPLTLLSGIELSTRYSNQNQHLVGLGLSPEIMRETYFGGLKEARNKRIEAIIQEIDEKRKTEQGVWAALGDRSLSIQEFYAFMGQSMPTRLHVGAYLWHYYGFGGNARGAMDIAVNRSLQAYDFSYETPLRTEDAIDLIHKYRGISIVPHLHRQSFSPIKKRGPAELSRVISSLQEQGLDGIEINPDDELQPAYVALAVELDLITSTGTDDHGANGPTYYGTRNQVYERVEIPEVNIQALLGRLQLNH